MDLIAGTVGAEIILATGQDLSGAIDTKMKVLQPDGSIVFWDASLGTAEGELKHVTVAGDIDLVGKYLVSAYVEWGETSKYPGNPCTLYVLTSDQYATRAEVRAAINVPETEELMDEAIQSGIDRGTPLVLARLGGGESIELVWAAKVSAAAYFAALSYATRSNNIHPGALNPQTGRWEPVDGAEGRGWAQVLNHLKDVMDRFLDELTPNDPAPKKLRSARAIH